MVTLRWGQSQGARDQGKKRPVTLTHRKDPPHPLGAPGYESLLPLCPKPQPSIHKEPRGDSPSLPSATPGCRAAGSLPLAACCLWLIGPSIAGGFRIPPPAWLLSKADKQRSDKNESASPAWLPLPETQRVNLDLGGVCTSWGSESDGIPGCTLWEALPAVATFFPDLSPFSVRAASGPLPTETCQRIVLQIERPPAFPASGDKAGGEWIFVERCLLGKSTLKCLIIRYMNAYPTSSFFFLTHIQSCREKKSLLIRLSKVSFPLRSKPGILLIKEEDLRIK